MRTAEARYRELGLAGASAGELVEAMTRYEPYLMCDDIQATLAELRGKGVELAQEAADRGWGVVAAIRLPDGSELGIYEPKHPLPTRP